MELFEIKNNAINKLDDNYEKYVESIINSQ
jgi:hypothetical protein